MRGLDPDWFGYSGKSCSTSKKPLSQSVSLCLFSVPPGSHNNSRIAAAVWLEHAACLFGENNKQNIGSA